jgi:hypothetical protein
MAARDGGLTVDDASFCREWVLCPVLVLSASALPITRRWAAPHRLRCCHSPYRGVGAVMGGHVLRCSTLVEWGCPPFAWGWLAATWRCGPFLGRAERGGSCGGRARRNSPRRVGRGEPSCTGRASPSLDGSWALHWSWATYVSG